MQAHTDRKPIRITIKRPKSNQIQSIDDHQETKQTGLI